MIVSSSLATLTEHRAMADMFELYERYRHALECMADLYRPGMRDHSLRDFTELQSRYLAALKAVTFDHKNGTSYQGYQRRLLYLKKTIAGLVQLLSRHAVRKRRPSQPPVSLFYRVRQITVTHPAIAPPQFA